jgi:16S rRNA G1207 methylase RsmC
VGEADIEANHRVLEPSAGTGVLLRAIDAATEGTPDKVAVEINPALVEGLARCGCSGLHIHQGDFLEQNGNLGKFDRIVMNPPFQNGADIKHIRHAAGFLADGGRLVALCANGPRQREILKPMAEESGGWWEDLPAGTFEEQGTGVNVALLLICNG